MTNTKNFSITARLASFKYALRGIVYLVRQEHNMRIHLVASLVVIIAGIIRQISIQSWIAISIAITLVWMAEAFNTTIEMLCDLYCENRYHSFVKFIKDVSASAVLFTAALSLVIAVFVFFF